MAAQDAEQLARVRAMSEREKIAAALSMYRTLRKLQKLAHGS